MAVGGDKQGRDNLSGTGGRVGKAAQYVRMSTEHQRYSTENQAEAIALYAERRGFEIVATYADEGKSGLRLDGREALQRLIADVKAGHAGFSAILVYDVSRWGRFQDADESAYYEFICKEAGISVQYCAEQFENDGSLSATIIKGMKRAMAGEYSRELSTKVFAGQCRLVSLGYRQGGPPGYGLRRQLIDDRGRRKAVLGHGEQKSLQADRVILIPGPPNECDIVHRIYDLFVTKHLTEQEISTRLNQEGLPAELGLGWSRGKVHQILTNEKYIGNNVYNRRSFKLKGKHVANPPEMWIRADGAFEPIVGQTLFEAAQSIIAARSRHYSDAEMLELLASLKARLGAISGFIIDEQEDMPSSSVYRHRFGSLVRAYTLIGHVPGRDYRFLEINHYLRAIYPHHVATMVAGIEQAGGRALVDAKTELLHVNEEFSAAIVFCRCRQTPAGSLRWKLRFDNLLQPDITLAVRMEPDNQTIRDYYLLPRIDTATFRRRLAEDNGLYLDTYRLDTLEPFYRLAGHNLIQQVAA